MYKHTPKAGFDKLLLNFPFNNKKLECTLRVTWHFISSTINDELMTKFMTQINDENLV